MTLFPGTALITGAASGIGRQTALSFAAEGCMNIALTDLNAAGLDETRALICEQYEGVRVELFVTDVSNEESVMEMTASVVVAFGRIDYAVNSAGVGGHNSISTETSSETYDRVTSINARGLWLCSRAQLGHMLKQEPLPTHDGRPGNRGSVVNIGSQLGVVSRPAAVAYSAAKAAVISMTRSDAIDGSTVLPFCALKSWLIEMKYAKDDIRVNCVSPGLIATPMNASPEKREVFGPAISIAPMNRMGTPQEVADAVLFMSSSKATFCQGANLIVDGGYVIN